MRDMALMAGFQKDDNWIEDIKSCSGAAPGKGAGPVWHRSGV